MGFFLKKGLVLNSAYSLFVNIIASSLLTISVDLVSSYALRALKQMRKEGVHTPF